MKKKKFLAVLCACAIAFSLAVPAFAEASPDEIANGTQIIFTGTFPDDNTTVSVSVLTGLTNLYVNPYGLPYTIDDGEVMEPDADDPQQMVSTGEYIKEGTTTDGWFSNTAAIRNDSNAQLDVLVTMTTTEKGGVKVELAPADPDNFTPTDNTLYGNFEIVTARGVADQDESGSPITMITPGDWDSADTVAIPAGSGTANTPGRTDKNHATGFVLNGVGEEMDEDTGEMVSVPTYAAFRLRGSAVIGSSTSSTGSDADGWLNTDVADVVVAFSFKPHTP